MVKLFGQDFKMPVYKGTNSLVTCDMTQYTKLDRVCNITLCHVMLIRIKIRIISK